MGVHITRRFFVKSLGLLSASAALAACAPSQQQGDSATAGQQDAAPLIAIIYTNDTHGHDIESEATEKNPGNFSMAAVAQLKKEWQDKGYDVLLLDAGDATQGMPLVDQSKGESAIAFMNSCGYDLMTIGNHEFDRGAEELAKYQEMAEFSLISANVMRKDTDERLYDAHKVFELMDGTKVGVFGLTTPATPTTTNPNNVADMRFLGGDELYTCAQAQVDELRSEGCDVVICLGHLGNEEVVKPSTSRDVLQNVTGIDLFIDGHDHKLVDEEVNGALLVETECYLYNIGLVVIDAGVPENQSVAYGSYDGIDIATQAILDDVNTQVESELGVVLGHTNYFLDGNRDPGLRTQETNLGNFCADALKWSAEQTTGSSFDAAIANGGGIRASVDVGDITLSKIKEVFPFSNNVAVLKLTGAQLLEALEASCQAIGSNGAIGAFPQVAGIEFVIDATVPYEKGDTYPNSTFAAPAKPGARVTINSVGGRAFDPNETYSIATIDFLCSGGDTYYVFKQAADAEAPIICGFDYEAFSSYLIVACDHEVPERYAQPEGRITIKQ